MKLWKAERFDPAEHMDLYFSAGAQYFVSQVIHHDNFDNFNSTFHPWNHEGRADDGHLRALA